MCQRLLIVCLCSRDRRWNIPSKLQENVRRLVPCLLVEKVIRLPKTNGKRTVSYARVPVSLISFDLSTLRYAGLVTAGTLYNELLLPYEAWCYRPTLHAHAMLLFNTWGAQGGYEAMASRSADRVVYAIEKLPDSVIDASGKQLIRLLATHGGQRAAKRHLAEYMRKNKLVHALLCSVQKGSEQQGFLLHSISPDIIAEICKKAMQKQEELGNPVDDPAVLYLNMSYGTDNW